MPMMAITTNSSTSVNALFRRFEAGRLIYPPFHLIEKILREVKKLGRVT